MDFCVDGLWVDRGGRVEFGRAWREKGRN